MMKRASGLLILALATAQSAYAISPDNSATNRQHVATTGVTAEEQSTDERAEATTRRIRAQLMEREDLSTYAKNIKVVTNSSGDVVLSGPVHSNSEREIAARLASSIAAPGKVTNNLEVVTERNE